MAQRLADLLVPRGAVGSNPSVRTLSLESFISLSSEPGSLAGKEFQITTCSKDFSTTTVKITSDCILRFDSRIQYRVQDFIVENCTVEFHDLFLYGNLSFRSSRAKVCRCNLRWAGKGSDTLLVAEDSSVIHISDSSFIGHKDIGIAVGKNSTLRMENCEIGKCLMAGLTASEDSAVECTNCRFYEANDDLVTIFDKGPGTFRSCRFDDAGDTGLRVNTNRLVIIENCTFTRCKNGSFHGSRCPDCRIKNCQCLETKNSSLILRSTRCLINDVCVRKSGGNGIFVGSQSNVTVTNCRLEDNAYPAITICDRSVAVVESTVISRCELSGIAVRRGSTVSVSNSTIEETQEFGVVVSYSESVHIQSTKMGRCVRGFVSSCDHVSVHVQACEFAGPTATATHCYTGGFISIEDTRIAGFSELLLAVHHGGSIRFRKVTAQSPAVKPFIKVETARPVLIENCVIAGAGPFEMRQNLEAERARGGSFAKKPKCLRCHEIADCIFFACRHSLYCKKCWDGLSEKPQECPLCLFPIEKAQRMIQCGTDEGDDLCSICMTNPIDGIIGKCGHTLCSMCAYAWLEEHKECPYCRAEGSAFRPFVSYE
jgi:hypothetical protein